MRTVYISFSLTALLPPIPFPLNVLWDGLTAALTVLTAFGRADLRRFLTRTAALVAVSFSFCGVMVFVCTVFRPKGMEIYNDVVYFNISPFVLIILTLVCYYTLLLLKRFTKGAAGKQVCTVTLRCGGKTLILLNFSKRIIPFGSLGGEGILEGMRAESVQIDGRDISNRIYIGVCEGVLQGDVRAIVPYELAKQ